MDAAFIAKCADPSLAPAIVEQFISAVGSDDPLAATLKADGRPNRGTAMLTLASSKPQLAIDDEIDAATAASTIAQIHARIEELQVPPSVEEPFHLTPKEAIFARWLELSKTVQDVADVEDLSSTPFGKHLRS